MVNFKLFGINEIEIVNSALYEYRCAMIKSGNSARASKVLEFMDRLNSHECVCDQIS